MSAEMRVTRVIPTSRAQLWAELASIKDHVESMGDAVEVRSPQRTGIGTSFLRLRLEDRPAANHR
jgi:hypothetical protein